MPLVVGRVAALLSAILLTLAALSGPAAADQGSLRDRAGDTPVGPEGGRGLDITGARFANGNHRLRVVVSFAALRRGDLVVSVSPRGGDGVRLVSFYRPGRPARSVILGGSFDDLTRGRVDCGRYRVTWHPRAATAVLVMPARCLADGGYDDLRFAVLTENQGGDTDYAPERRAQGPRPTRWIGRG